jgi:hypothetical protein
VGAQKIVQTIAESVQDANGFCMTDWKPIEIYEVIALTVAQASNRVFVGTSHCELQQSFETSIVF